MQELIKEIDGRKYTVFGPNVTMLTWARKSDLAQNIFQRSNTNENVLFRAFGATDVEERTRVAKEAIKALWYGYSELGPYPFLETLSDFEFGRQFYPEYREHVIHQLKVFLSGVYFFDTCDSLRQRLLAEVAGENETAGQQEFVRRWIVCAIYHDIGYVLENEDANSPIGKAWLQTCDVMNKTLSAPLSTLPVLTRTLPETVERQIIRQEKLWCLEISYPKHIEFDEDNHDLLDLIADFGLRAGLGTSKSLGKSPIRSYYDYALSHEPVDQKRPRFRDHGIASALLLMRTWLYYKEHVERVCAFQDHPLLTRVIPTLNDIQPKLPACKESIFSAAGAIALHNITPSLWDSGDALTYALTLHEFCIRLHNDNLPQPLGSTPIAFLLGLTDTLQDWDRPRSRSPKEDDRPGLTDQDMSFQVAHDKICLFYVEDDKRLKNPAVDPGSIFSKTKQRLTAYLEPQAIEQLIAWCEPDTTDHAESIQPEQDAGQRKASNSQMADHTQSAVHAKIEDTETIAVCETV